MFKTNLDFKVMSASEGKDLEAIAKKRGIQYPSTHLAFFKSVYAEIETPNKNGVSLSREAVEGGLPGIIGCQINFNHWRSGYICGQLLDAWINDEDQIEIAFTFHRSVYPEKYEEALELLDQGELTVSFELRAEKENIEYMADGTRRLHKVDFDGVGLLMGEKPACPAAIVFETAKQKILDLIGRDTPDLVFARSAVTSCKDLLESIETAINDKKEGDNRDMDEKTNEALLAEFKKSITEEFGEEAVKDWTDEDFLNEEKIIDLRQAKEEAKETEEKAEEQKVSEEAEEESEGKEEANKEESEEVAQKCKMEQEINKKVTEEYDEESQSEVVKTEEEMVTKVNDEIVEVRKQLEEIMFNYAELEKKNAELEEALKSKEEEVAKIKENALKVAALRVELGDYSSSLSDEDLLNEDKVEIARLKKLNADFKNRDREDTFEIASEEGESLQTGNDETPKGEEKSDDQKISDYMKYRYSKMKKK